MNLYVDGVFVDAAGTPADHLIGDATDDFSICEVYGDQWIGKISYGAVWYRALSAAEVYQLYLAGPSLNLYQDPMTPYYGALGTGTPTFIPGWAANSNQVML